MSRNHMILFIYLCGNYLSDVAMCLFCTTSQSRMRAMHHFNAQYFTASLQKVAKEFVRNMTKMPIFLTCEVIYRDASCCNACLTKACAAMTESLSA